MTKKRTKRKSVWAEFDAALEAAGPDIDRSGVLNLSESDLMDLAGRAARESREADTLRREIRELEAAGVDVSMVRQALRQTPAERIASNDEALAFFAEIRVAQGAGGDGLPPHLKALYAEMQRPEVQAATDRALAADPREFGVAAVRAARRKK